MDKSVFWPRLWQVWANGCEDGMSVSHHPIQSDSNLETTLSCKVVGFFCPHTTAGSNPDKRERVLFRGWSREAGLRRYQTYFYSHHGFIAWTHSIFRILKALGLPVIRDRVKTQIYKHQRAAQRSTAQLRVRGPAFGGGSLPRSLEVWKRGGPWLYSKEHALNPFHRGNGIQYLAASAPADGSS